MPVEWQSTNCTFGHTLRLSTAAYSSCPWWRVSSLHQISCLAGYVAATGRSLGTLVQVETSSRGSKGSWYRARSLVSTYRIASRTRAAFGKPWAGARGTTRKFPEGSRTKPTTRELKCLGRFQVRRLSRPGRGELPRDPLGSSSSLRSRALSAPEVARG